ncbi:MAG: hypothetical protein R2764_18375 [Bacteroidales bacterium]
MIRVLTSAILLFTSLVFWGQEPDEVTTNKLENSTEYVNEDFNEEEIQKFIEEKKVGFQLEVGTSFGTGFGGGSYMTTYVAPHLSYKLSPKFTISGGAIVAKGAGNFYTEPLNNGIYSYYSPFYPRSFVYIEGAYHVNERLTLSGTAYKEVDVFNQYSNTNNRLDGDINGVIMGVDYKLRENVYIRGQIEISNGRNPYHHRGLGSWHSPFDSSDDPF